MLQAFKKIWNFADKEKSTINKSIVFVMINAFFQLFRIWAIYLVVTSLVRGETKLNIVGLTILLLSVSIAGLAFTQTFSQVMQTHAGYFMVANERISIANKLKIVPMGFFDSLSQGRITGIATTILENVEMGAPMVLVQLVGGFVGTLALIIMTMFFDYRIGLIVLVTVIVFLIVLSLMEKRSRQISPQRQESETSLVAEFMEHAQGISVIKAFNLTGKGDKSVREAIENNRDKNQKLERLFTPYTILQAVSLQIGSFFIMVLSGIMYVNGSMPLDKAVMSVILSFLVFSKIEMAGMSMSLLRLVSSSISQTEEIDRFPSIDINGVDIHPETHDIELKDVHFSYGGNEVIRGISLRVPNKTSLAIVGYSGSGKSTLASLIARFWDIQSGSISIGGINIKNYSLQSLMEQISIVFQDVYLFEDTIENNIKFGVPEASHNQVVEAARKASCLEFINKLPDGFETTVGEGGQTLSGGEKQRISIARAILKDSPIIILDEATASVDSENEDKLIEALEELTKEKTVIMIAHRLKTVRHADNIIVLKDGKIVEEGKHEELIKEEGIYKKFVVGKQEAASWKI